MQRICNLRFLIALISIAFAGLLVLPEKVAKSNSTTAAQPSSPMAGELDLTFALDGTTLTGFGTADDFGRAAAIQPDGKIVVAGYGVNVSPNSFIVARYNTDGSLDPTFNASGEVFTSIFNNTTAAYAVAIQPDGKIVAAGSAPTSDNGSNSDFAVVRYNPNGLLDTTFNSTGKVTTPIGSFSGDSAYAVAIQSDGKIVAAGETVESGNHNFAVVRYNTDGSLDTTFNQTGKVTTSLGVADAADAVTIQTDGKIVVAGGTFNGVDGDFALVRYNPDGSLDTSFNSTGKLITAIGPGNDVIHAVALQSDGKIVVAGYAGAGVARSSNDFAVVRYNTDGSLDTTFNGTGKAITDFPDPFNPINDYAYAVAIQADGKIVAAGTSGPSNRESFAVVRYNADGSLDTSFNSTGRVLTPIGNMTDAAYAVAIQTDGKIVTAGTSRDDPLNQGGGLTADNDFALVRYNSDGTLDTSFDADGIRLHDFGNRFAVAGGTAIQTDGKIVVAGYSYGFSASGVAISVFSAVRYNPDGTLDRTFNGSGKVTTPIGEANGYAYAVALQSDGKIVVAGAAFSGSNGDFALVRYNTDGSLDTSFNSTGMVTTPIGSGNDEAFAVAIERSQGRIVAAGRSDNGSYYDVALVRYNADGSLDTSFNSTGKVTTQVGPRSSDAYAVKLQSDGKIVAAGNSYGDYNFAVVRYNTDGSLDTTFNGTGKVITFGTAKSLAIQADGKIVAAGYASGFFAIVRLNTDGSFDTSFNSTGHVVAPVGQAYAVAIQSDGKIVAAGYSYAGQTPFGPTFDFALVRYNANGSLDTMYGIGGKVVLDLNYVDAASALALDAMDRAVVAGYAGGVFGVARVLGGPTRLTPVLSDLSSPAITYGTASTTLSGTISAGSGIPSGNVTITLNGITQSAPIASDGSFSSGFATGALGVAGSPYSITYTYAGDANFNGAEALSTLTVNKAIPTISWSNPADITYGTALSSTQLNATANVPGTFIYTPATGAVLAAGSARTLSVNFTPADTTNYNSASASVLINVGKATPTVNVTGGTFTYDGNPHPATGSVTGVGGANLGTPSFAYTPGGSSAPVNAGTYAVTGSFAGDANYNAASASATITINKAPATISLSNLTQTYDGSPKSATATTNPSGLIGVSITYNGSAAAPTNAGSYAVVATLTNDDYTASNATGTLVIAKATPSITWTNPADIVYGTALSSTQLNATANVPGTFTYTPATGTVLAAGNARTLSVNFTPADTTNYNSASASVLINVLKATPTVSVTGGTFTYDGNPHPATGSVTGVGGANLGTPGFVYAPGGSSAPVNAGNYSVTGSFAGAANYNAASASATITINKAPATITLSNLTHTYDGSPKSATATTSPAGLGGVSITYDGSTAPPTNPGSYAVVASLNNLNYQAPNAAGTLVIAKRPTKIAYTGDTLVACGGTATLQAVLTDITPPLGSTPVPVVGRTVTLTLGSGPTAQSCTGTTDSRGLVRCTVNPVNQPLAPSGSATAVFAGDDVYLPSNSGAQVTFFTFRLNSSAPLFCFRFGNNSGIPVTINSQCGQTSIISVTGSASSSVTGVPASGTYTLTELANNPAFTLVSPSSIGKTTTFGVNPNGGQFTFSYQSGSTIYLTGTLQFTSFTQTTNPDGNPDTTGTALFTFVGGAPQFTNQFAGSGKLTGTLTVHFDFGGGESLLDLFHQTGSTSGNNWSGISSKKITDGHTCPK